MARRHVGVAAAALSRRARDAAAALGSPAPSPYGLAGGQPGAASNNLLDDAGTWRQLPTKFTRPLATGQALRHTTAGGGGYGDPLRRDPALVLADVRNGKVTLEGAHATTASRAARAVARRRARDRGIA